MYHSQCLASKHISFMQKNCRKINWETIYRKRYKKNIEMMELVNKGIERSSQVIINDFICLRI